MRWETFVLLVRALGIYLIKLADSLAWMIFWNNNNLKVSNVFVVINSVAQLYYISRRLPPIRFRLHLAAASKFLG